MSSSQSQRWTVVALMVAGFLLMQVAWFLVVVPYHGMDEYDHAYRAAAVARGQWVAPPSDATRGTGATLRVPADIVAAAGPVCQDWPYADDADCVGRPVAGTDMVDIASGAGRYNPVFYAIVGTAALPFTGHDALYAMRVASGLLTLLFVGLAAWSMTAWPRPRLGLLGLALAATPMVMYSAAMVAPNGLEIVAGMALWASLLPIAVGTVTARTSLGRRLLTIAGLSAVTLATVRSLGPLWLGLIGLAIYAFARFDGRRSARDLLADARHWATPTVVVAVMAGLAWTLTQGAWVIGVVEFIEKPSFIRILRQTLNDLPKWVFQSVATFPARDVLVAWMVYIVAFIVMAVVLLEVWRRADRSLRWAVAGVAVASLIVPYGITVATYTSFAESWQGRYTMPFSVGVAIGACWALARSTKAPPRWFAPVLVGLLGIAQAWCVAFAGSWETANSPLASSQAWVTLPIPALAGIVAVGQGLLCWAILRARVDDSDRADDVTVGGATGGLQPVRELATSMDHSDHGR